MSLVTIKALKQERQAHKFLMNFLGLVSLIEQQIDHLEDETQDYSSHDLSYINFGYYSELFSTYLSDPENIKAFKRFYPGHAHLLDHGSEILPAIQRLRQARYDLLESHLVETKDDLQRDPWFGVVGATKADRCQLLGLTEAQLAIHDAQLDRFGHFLLGQTERRALAAAYRAELEEAPVEPDASAKKARAEKLKGSRKHAGPSVPSLH